MKPYIITALTFLSIGYAIGAMVFYSPDTWKATGLTRYCKGHDWAVVINEYVSKTEGKFYCHLSDVFLNQVNE